MLVLGDLDLEEQCDAGAELPGTIVGQLTPVEARPSDARPRPLIERVTETQANVLVLDRSAQTDAALLPDR